jgi:hypothetical protein
MKLIAAGGIKVSNQYLPHPNIGTVPWQLYHPEVTAVLVIAVRRRRQFKEKEGKILAILSPKQRIWQLRYVVMTCQLGPAPPLVD